jgi:hypothetical protein
VLLHCTLVLHSQSQTRLLLLNLSRDISWTREEEKAQKRIGFAAVSRARHHTRSRTCRRSLRHARAGSGSARSLLSSSFVGPYIQIPGRVPIVDGDFDWPASIDHSQRSTRPVRCGRLAAVLSLSTYRAGRWKSVRCSAHAAPVPGVRVRLSESADTWFTFGMARCDSSLNPSASGRGTDEIQSPFVLLASDLMHSCRFNQKGMATFLLI